MPTYGYICDKCGHEFETVQPMTSEALQTCPENLCAKKRWGRGKVKRTISAGGGLLFKGSGFYITDYRSEGYKQAAQKDSKPAATSPATTDSKPAAKAETKPSKPATS
jgi:putative FmdB family regulatory protein